MTFTYQQQVEVKHQRHTSHRQPNNIVRSSAKYKGSLLQSSVITSEVILEESVVRSDPLQRLKEWRNNSNESQAPAKKKTRQLNQTLAYVKLNKNNFLDFAKFKLHLHSRCIVDQSSIGSRLKYGKRNITCVMPQEPKHAHFTLSVQKFKEAVFVSTCY